MKKMKKGGAGECTVFICDICGDQITSVRIGGYESEKIGDNIHICSACCSQIHVITENDHEKAMTFVKIYGAMEHPRDIAKLPFWPRTPDGKIMSFGKIFAIARA